MSCEAGFVVAVFMLDSNVFDHLLKDAQVCGLLEELVDSGRVTLLSTHVQRDELAAKTDDLEKRAALLECHDRLTRSVPTGAFVLDVSRFDAARFGPAVGEAAFDDVLRTPRAGRRDGMPGHTNDALITDTALAEDAILVSSEEISGAGGRILRRAKESG
jgi:hypothetical protein